MRSRTPLALGACAIALGGCASAWRLEPATGPRPDLPSRPGPCRVIAAISLDMSGRTLPAVAYVSMTGAGNLRAHLDTESGLTILDLEIRDGVPIVHRQSALAGLPGLTDTLATDLRRALGDHGVYAVAMDAGAGFATVTEGPRGLTRPWAAWRLPDASWVALDPAPAAGDDVACAVTLLDAARVPVATVEYGAPGTANFPWTIRLRDLGDGHVVRFDVGEVLPGPGTAGGDEAP